MPAFKFHSVSVVIALGKRPVTCRTRKLSLSAPMVLQGGPCGRVGRRRTNCEKPRGNRSSHGGFLCLRDLGDPRYGVADEAGKVKGHRWYISPQEASRGGPGDAGPDGSCPHHPEYSEHGSPPRRAVVPVVGPVAGIRGSEGRRLGAAG